MRILRYGGCSAASVVIGLLYLNRLKAATRSTTAYILTSRNHIILLTVSIMVANKFADDERYSIVQWGKIGGVSTEVLKESEIAFLSLLEFHLSVTTEEYKAFLEGLLFPDSSLSTLSSADTEEACIHSPRLSAEWSDSWIEGLPLDASATSKRETTIPKKSSPSVQRALKSEKNISGNAWKMSNYLPKFPFILTQRKVN